MEGAGNVKLYNEFKGGAITLMQQGNRNLELRYLGFCLDLFIQGMYL